jgi:hypothetical protein
MTDDYNDILPTNNDNIYLIQANNEQAQKDFLARKRIEELLEKKRLKELLDDEEDWDVED